MHITNTAICGTIVSIVTTWALSSDCGPATRRLLTKTWTQALARIINGTDSSSCSLKTQRVFTEKTTAISTTFPRSSLAHLDNFPATYWHSTNKRASAYAQSQGSAAKTFVCSFSRHASVSNT